MNSATSCVGPALLLFLFVLYLAPCEAQFRSDLGGGDDDKACPVGEAKKGFDVNKFLGDWYVLEYEYPKEMRLKDISCVGLHFSLTSFGDILTNFTFRFPAKSGHFYHVPTFSIVSQLKTSVWETQFRGVELVSAILDTDYENWAVLAQCSEAETKNPRFLSTRVLARSRNLGASDWIGIQTAIETAGAAAPFVYPVDQEACQELDM